ncbi:hypothetical protein HY504_00080 [Candidatus Wolfebacteria bacterium]|nr:hypothetical protein [Candidatus Wolfebacteria bacterium]
MTAQERQRISATITERRKALAEGVGSQEGRRFSFTQTPTLLVIGILVLAIAAVIFSWPAKSPLLSMYDLLLPRLEETR